MSVRMRTALAALAMAALVIPASPTHAKDCGLKADQVFAQSMQSVARVFVISVDPFDPRRKVGYGVGTGFVIGKDGAILTNYHVILNARIINIAFDNGKSFAARFVAGDPILDIAILAPVIEGTDLKPLQLAADAPPTIGTPVFAIGHPLGLQTSISAGIVSSVDVVLPISNMSWDEPLIQTDAAINPGNSGGPLLNNCGQVVGMNTLVARDAENLGFAIPAATLQNTVKQLQADGRVKRPWIGISGRMSDPFILGLGNVSFVPGFMIETIEPGSAAEVAGLRGGMMPMRLGPSDYLLGGDIITAVNGEEITDLATTAKIVRALKPGDVIKVTYYRDGEEHELEAKLPERPALADDIRVLYGRSLENQNAPTH